MCYPWYKILAWDEKISQGDIIFDLVVPAPQFDPSAQHLMKTFYKRKNVIVMTQACDLENEKIESVKVCAIIPLEDFVQQEFIKSEIESRKSTAKSKNQPINTNPIVIDYSSTKNVRKKEDLLKKLRTGGFLDLYLLNEESTIGSFNPHIVNLREEYTLPLATLKKFIRDNERQRFSLQPPYREHLNQAYVNLYSRIGLPQDIVTSNLTINLNNNFDFTEWDKKLNG